MDTERSFVMMKPDGVERGLTDEVVRRLEAAGLKMIAQKKMMATPEIVAKHYPMDDNYLLTMGHRDPSGWSEEEKQTVIARNKTRVMEMHEFIQSGPVIPMIFEGPVGTVERVREVVGATNPPDAAPGTIRKEFGQDSYAATDEYQEKTGKVRSVHNIVHASGNPAEAENEIAIWFPEFAR